MAEVTAFRNNALPYPVYGVPWAVVYPMLDADGDLVTGASTPDAERSLNGDTFADCTNDSVEIATASGIYYLLLTGAEMTADIVAVIAKSATAGMKTTALTFYPRKLVSLRAGTAAGGAAGSITLDAGASAADDFYNGCLVVGVLDSATEARIITDYAGSTKVASVTPNWNTTPDSDDTFTIYLTDARQINSADVNLWLGTAAATPTVAGVPEVDVTHWIGTAAATPTVAGVPEVDMTHLGGVAQSATDLKDFADDGYDPATNKVQGVVLTDTVTTYTGNTPQTGDVFPLASTEIADIKAKTDLIPAAPASTTNITAGTITTVTNLTNAPTAGDLTATMKASINAEVLDVLNTDTFAEPGQEAPPATASIIKKLGYLYKQWRNKSTSTATTVSLFADDGTTVDQKFTDSDDLTTFTKGEVGTGP